MPLPRDQKIIVTSADGTRRRRLPAAQITDANARIERYGGYGQFQVNTAIPYKADALSTVVKGDRVEFYYQGTLRYRGYIEERLQTEGEPDTLSFTGYGMSFLAGQQLCPGRYAYAGVGKDIGDVFAEIVRDANQSRSQSLPAAAGRQGLPIYGALQVLKVGMTTTFVDAYRKLFKDAANDLVQSQAANLAIWGGDVDAFQNDRLYIRPVAPTTFPAMHTLLVPSRQTEAAQAEDQAGDVKNRVLMTGGQPRFPQLVHNGGFDLPVVFQQGDSGLIADGDFENQSWSLGSGASYKDAGHNEGQPFSGNWMVELDHAGESADKSGQFASAPVAGDSYVFSVRAKKEVGLQVAGGSGWLHVQDANGNLLLNVPLMVAPAGTAWDYFSQTFPMPAGAAKWAAHFQCDHIASYGGDQGGLLIDAVALEDASVIYQDGYQTAVYGSAQFLAVNWTYKDTCYDGLYCVYVNVSAQDVDGQDAHLEPLNRARFNISVKQTLRGSFRYRSPVQATPGLALPKMRLHLDWYRGDGSYIGNSGVDVAAQAVSSTWQYLELVAAPPGDAASCCATVIFRTRGEALIDAISVQDAEAVLAGDTPMDQASANGAPDGHPGYLPEGALSTFLTAGASGLGGGWAASEAQYGSRVDIAAEGSVDTLGGLTQVAVGRLRNTALPLTRPTLTRIADPRVYWPGDSISLQGRHGAALSGGTGSSGGQILTIAAVMLTLGDQFKVKLEIDKEQPSTDLIVKRLIQDQLGKNGPSGGGNTGGGGGYSNPTNFGGAGGSQGAAYRSTLQASQADPTLHDSFTGVPHASAASQAGWTGTTGEVVAARTRTVKGVSSTSLEGRLDAMEQDIVSASSAAGGSTGAAPATASAFGTVKTDTTEQGGSVVYTKTTLDTLLAGKISVGAALPESEITGLLADLSNKITVGAALSESEITNLVSDLGSKIAAGSALPESEITNLVSDLAGKIAAGSALPESEITNLAADLAARIAVVGAPADGQVPTWVASASQYQLKSPASGSSLTLTECLGNGADLALSAAYQTVPTISVSVGANAAVDADALVEIVADAATGYDDLYVQLYDTIAAAPVPYSERHVSHIPAGKRGQIALSKYVAGLAAGRTLVLQAKNGTAARGTLSTNKSLLQALGVSSGTSTGGGITSPTQVSGLTVWLNAGAITGTASGSALASWADASGNGHNAAQATAGSQPVYIASGLASKPVVRFNGSSQFMSLGDLSAAFPAAATLFAVVTYNGSQNQVIYSTSPFNSSSNAGDDFSYYTGNGGSYWSVFTAPRTATYGSPMPVSGANLFSLVSGPSAWELWVNQVDKGSVASTFAPGTSHLLGHSNCPASNCYLNGDISELLIYRAALSAADRQNVEGYLKAKYGI